MTSLQKDLRAHAALMGKLLPYNVTADLNVSGVRTLKIVSVPHDRYLSPDQVRTLSGLDPPPVIENDPPPDPPSDEIEVELSNVHKLNPWDSDR